MKIMRKMDEVAVNKLVEASEYALFILTGTCISDAEHEEAPYHFLYKAIMDAKGSVPTYDKEF